MDVENAPSEKSLKCILAPPVVSWRTRTAGNDILPRPIGGGYSSLFFRRGTTLLSGRVLVDAESWQRHSAAAARRWVFVTVFPSRHYTAVRSRLGARGTMTDKRRVLSLK
ncbi:hypothetical protein TNIN_11 [Trichonephila inaurata madagascariensis]|uniref:Uncharacterized protein n=1 Tax=Trichonephila inaurata madagascariensis TaxID=2747483 RepID=A0A8X6WTB2_9ARAC|nr:hypothetical protein TNIN_11 [Trichonephila inaurata madagascariensis]